MFWDRRVEALGLTRLGHVTLDTSAKDWDAYARAIAAFAGHT